MLSIFSKDVEEITRLLVLSHASSGKSVCISRHGQVLVNLSAKSTINEWTPRNKVIQTALLDMIGDGDGGKLGSFIFTSLFRSISKEPESEQINLARSLPQWTQQLSQEIYGRSQTSSKQDLIQVAHDFEFAEALADAALASSQANHISIEKYDGIGVELLQTESFISEARPLYLDQEEIHLKGPMFALFEYPLSDFSDIEEALSLMGSFENRPLIVIAPLIRGEALSTIKVNRENNIVQSYAIEAPLVTWGKGWLDDVASYVGATPHNKFLHGEFQTHYFGSAREITIKDKEIILDPYDDHVEVTSARISQLLAEAENTPFPHTQDQLKRRASNLSGSLIRLRIGGSTETEARIRRNKAEKNLLSLSDMVQYGHVLGEAKTLSDISTLFPYPLNKALCAPLKVISLNKQQPNLSLLLEDPALKHPFPTHRLVNLVTRAISLAHTLGSVGLVLRSQK